MRDAPEAGKEKADKAKAQVEVGHIKGPAQSLKALVPAHDFVSSDLNPMGGAEEGDEEGDEEGEEEDEEEVDDDGEEEEESDGEEGEEGDDDDEEEEEEEEAAPPPPSSRKSKASPHAPALSQPPQRKGATAKQPAKKAAVAWEDVFDQ